MTAADASRMPKYAQVAAAIRRQIADGALRPGQPAPSGAELSRATGFATLTCRRALRALIADGTLVSGPSPNARPRVADPGAHGDQRDLAEATRALSAGLAAARRAAGLTQVELAALADVSVTTVGHAETGRTWQSRRFWERADAALGAAGALLRLHDAYRAAGSAYQEQKSKADFMERSVAPPGLASAPSLVPGPAAPVGAADGVGPGAFALSSPLSSALSSAPSGPPAVPAQAVPSRIMIVWTDGTVTTVLPPAVKPA